MFGSTSCTGTLISTPDIHPSLLQPGNLVPKDLLSITSTWKLNTEGFTNPRICTGGVCFFLFKWSSFTEHRNPEKESWSFNRHHPHLATCIRRNASILCQCFKTSHINKTRRKKEPLRQDLFAKCQVIIETKTSTFSVTNIYTIFDT